MRKHKIPIRKCLITNQSYPKKELTRIVRTPNGEVLVDLSGKANGRGAYIKLTRAHVETLNKTKIIDKVLEVKVTDALYQELLSLCKE